MKLVMTLMVRDEVDIVAAMIEHHLHQQVDLIIVTDNGSVDGTREVLEEYARSTDRLIVRDHLTQDKNQRAVVTSMAREAAMSHGADWVINADADEFYFPTDPSHSLKSALEEVPKSVGAFRVPVVNMTGQPAKSGPWIDRLHLRDERSLHELRFDAGLLEKHPPKSIHVASPDVTVRQGNHTVELPGHDRAGQAEIAPCIEILHFPWRNYRQFEQKVVNAGRAYSINRSHTPAPRHLTTRDFRYYELGLLPEYYVYHHPVDAVPGPSLESDRRLSAELRGLLGSGEALLPEALGKIVSDEEACELYKSEFIEEARTRLQPIFPIENERIERLEEALEERDRESRLRRRVTRERDRAREEVRRVTDSLDYRIGSRLLRPARAALRLSRRVRGIGS